jgi:photosystem II stability/assembly factor-like uncharacterized protein
MLKQKLKKNYLKLKILNIKMKKVYLSLLSVILTIAFILAVFNFKKNEAKSISKTFTSEELWDIQYQQKKEKRKVGYSKTDNPDKFVEYLREITTPFGEKESGYKMNYKVRELVKAKANRTTLKSAKAEYDFVSRGPANIGGRTRAIIVDPDDNTHNTWLTGTSSGGIWKTTNGGTTWKNLSDEFTNLSVCALAMAGSNHDIIYAGTGESMPAFRYMIGNGIWKSTDRGLTWSQLSSTATNTNFSYVNRLIVDPNNANIVLAATEKGILKSNDGGITWTHVHKSNRGVEDLIENPVDFNILFAGENSVGVLRSSDAGDTWQISSNGLIIGARHEVTVSKINTNKVFVSIHVSTDLSYVFMSEDSGVNWVKFDDNQNFLGGQGGYDNIIEAHPFNENEVFVAGVDSWKLNFNGNTHETEPVHKGAYTVGTSFLSFVDYGGAFLAGGMDTTETTNRTSGDWVSIELRFGPGISQKAHRFYVPLESTSGVARNNYTYQDYVDVPFQVWDVTNNKQLMVSFRDQERDGEFNLYTRHPSSNAYGDLGREYIFLNAVAYNANNPNSTIAKTGGHYYKNLYMIWPELTEGATWDQNNLPESELVIGYGSIQAQAGEKTSIADSYGNFGGPNGYNQSAGFGTTKIPGLHPDHHNIVLIPTSDNTFTFIDANDGGLGISFDNGLNFNMLPNNYITTQFYGVAKNPQANEYFGGMQDNGTWQSQSGENASNTSKYLFRLGGDGFECLWHAYNPNLILGSVYNNAIKKSENGGLSWTKSAEGIEDEDGPFITHLSVSKEKPDLVFAVGKTGIYRSVDFGDNWNMRTISSDWISGDILSSSTNVDGKIVWAGAGMSTSAGLKMHVSKNEGLSFTPVNNYTEVPMSAYISGLATHPTEENTAYVLYALAGKPKIIRTENLGESWEDISGFANNSSSSNSFPDVITSCLLVMPHNPNIIWAGTDIGLVESTNNGGSWHLADYNLPAVSIWNMHIVGNQVVIATHGRGIWSVNIPEIHNAPYIKTFAINNTGGLSLTTNFIVAYDKVEVYIDGELNQTLDAPAVGSNDISITMDEVGTYKAQLIGYIDANSYKSNTIDAVFNTVAIQNNSFDEFLVYPNPSKGKFSINTNYENANIQIYDLSGTLVFKRHTENTSEVEIDIRNLNTGTYIIKIDLEKGFKTQKILIQD